MVENETNIITDKNERNTGDEINGKHALKEKLYSVDKIRQTHSQAYAKWTAADEEILRNEFLNGKTVNELSRLLGRKNGGIRSRLVKLGLINKERYC